MAKKHTIWSSEINLKDWADYIYEGPMNDYIEDGKIDADMSVEDFMAAYEDECYRWVADLNNDYLGDERINLNVTTKGRIICIADLGLWNGRRKGYKILSNNISNCLSDSCNEVEWYVEGVDMKATAHHHDGTNYYLYRELKPGLSEAQEENFLDKIYNGVVTKQDITRYTKSIGHYAKEVYGW